MVTGWVVSITLFAVCGLVALAIVKIIDYLDRTTSIAEDVEAEVRSPYDADCQGLQALVGDEETKIPVALAGAIANNELDTLPGSIERADTEQQVASRLDSRSPAVNEGETSADR